MIILMIVCGLLWGYFSLPLADALVKVAAHPTKVYPTPSRLTFAAMGGVIFGLLYHPADFVVVGILTAFLLLIVVIDVKYHLILNVMVYPAVLLALGWMLLGGDPRTMLVGGLFAFSIFYMVRRINPSQLGGGDVKLAALLGIVFGFPHILFVLLIGTGSGAVAAVLALRGGKGQMMPYAPFLCLGALLVLLMRGIVW